MLDAAEAEEKLPDRKVQVSYSRYGTIENHSLDWDNAKKLEQVPDWRMRWINKGSHHHQSTPHNFNHLPWERHILPNVWDSPVF